MNFYIITIHRSSNYGAVFQAYATQRFFEAYGRAYVLNYETFLTKNSMRVIRYPLGVKGVASSIKDLVRYNPRKRLINKFECFVKTYMNMISIDEAISEGGSEESCFISGSDQIWNPKIAGYKRFFDKNYFLDFVKSNKKIAFASSFGDYSFNTVDIAYIANVLTGYKYIGIREKDRTAELGKILNTPVSRVLDPTLMVGESFWKNEFDLKFNESNYILVYRLQKDDYFDKVVNNTSTLLGMNVKVITQEAFIPFLKGEKYNDLGPEEFLKLFYNSKFVITNSFHGVAFSLIFRKRFLVPKAPHGMVRISSLLKDLSLESRIVDRENSSMPVIEKLQCDIDFSNVWEVINAIRMDIVLDIEKKILD
ncbi:hypothetical protein GCM10011352_36250 [Marinobacterium zhoushanense]|uniref:Polysaccharide pyruvyl transferase domain-containing protein n=1 Tax=Marinobacterium zhoushanense TaxID=1679163 RepID=A0ABQ1KSR5_9GAMM|nr:polysaccharide pyruvyl transferase family protein [Marinobacterium zhoushanense]GGC06764.1 hypothetical protein GCM10011352_36250 [Marinobacterium zhoushanense]